MKTINIINFYASDLRSVAEGGIASYVREILKQSDSEVTYSLAGVTKNYQNRVGSWGLGEFENIKFNFFPVLSTRKDHITYRKGIPLNARYLFRLFRYRSKIIENSDSLHFHRVELALPFILFCKNKVPIIITIHGNNYDFNIAQKHTLYNKKWFRYIFHKLEEFVIRRADKIIFVSFEALKVYSDIYPKIKEKFIFLPTFVDMESFKPMEKEECRQEQGLEISKKTLLFVGRLDEQKGLDLLLDAYVLCLKENKHNFILFLVGDGVARQRLHNRVTNERIEGVRFLGNIQHFCLPRIINCADVFVLTSLWEGMPIVLIEALACGIPVVATNVGQIQGMVKDGLNGFIIYERNPRLVKEAILKTLDLNNNIRQACRNSVLSFSSSSIVKKIENIHKSLLNKYLDKIK